jgi:hypothetical protein
MVELMPLVYHGSRGASIKKVLKAMLFATDRDRNMLDRKERQIAIFHQIARHLLALVYLIAELVLGDLMGRRATRST